MLDHLVLAVPDLDAAIGDIAARLGIQPSPGGQHLWLGTRNYLLSLGEESYLEIIGPDPEQHDPVGGRPLGVDMIQEPTLVAWAARTMNIERQVELARARGYDPGDVTPMSRSLSDGTVLTMKRTRFPGDHTLPNPVPFLIDWGGSPHPSLTASRGARLVEFRAEVTDLEEVEARLGALGVGLPVSKADASRLIALVETPRGPVRL